MWASDSPWSPRSWRTRFPAGGQGGSRTPDLLSTAYAPGGRAEHFDRDIRRVPRHGVGPDQVALRPEEQDVGRAAGRPPRCAVRGHPKRRSISGRGTTSAASPGRRDLGTCGVSMTCGSILERRWASTGEGYMAFLARFGAGIRWFFRVAGGFLSPVCAGLFLAFAFFLCREFFFSAFEG